MDYLIRFLAGGVLVSLFAIVGDVLRPKSFAGLIGAAPSVALATLTLAFSQVTLPRAPSLLQRLPGSQWRSCSGACGAQCAFTERETRNQISLSAVRMPDLR
jgi:hypothetical protein